MIKTKQKKSKQTLLRLFIENFGTNALSKISHEALCSTGYKYKPKILT